MKMVIIDKSPRAHIFIDGQEVKGVVKYKIKRKINDLPKVVITFKPCDIDMDLSDPIIKSRIALIAPQIRCQIEYLISLFKTKKMLSRKSKEHKKRKPISHEINSPKCGRDKKGIFHCECGKCKPSSSNISQNRSHGSNDSGNSRND
ncbi:MAG: hypothetical protein NC122_07435 [Faecalibacterium sp.]|nr:hypothetical protein [Ruminococcus sp.]MCM1392172.1 hypothetical protein [Ruminococcus sp.]MCM1486024.1 hypothetical protein [Faecalibacterium sp.]